MKNSFLILGFLISLLISCPPPTPEPGPDEGGSGSGNETAKEFTVSFDANGGTGTIAPMKVKAGTEITLPDGTAFTRKYYTFNYWTISGLDFYEADSKYTVKADTVFTAAWRHNQVSITYDSNHEELNKKEETWGDAGSDLILPGNLFDPSPAGKYFHGWTTDAAATEDDILAPGSAFRVEETALTFYAYWGDTSVPEYTVKFSGTEMKPITFNKYTEEICLPLYTGEPGMVCKGWDTDAAAKTVVYEDGGIIPKEDLTGDIVLYPILEDVRVALTWEKNGNVSPDNSNVFPDRVAPGDFFFMAYAVTKDSGDGKVWILDSVTAKTVSGKTVPTRKEMMDGIAEVWHISVPAEATVITLNWKEKTDVTVTSLTVYDYEYTEGDPAIDFRFTYKADFDPAKGNLKITKDGQEVEILSYHYEFYTAEEKVGFCELSPKQGAGQYLLQIIVNGNVLKKASFNVTLTDSSDPTTPQTHTVTFNAGGGTGTVDPMTAEAGTVITLPSADGLFRQYYTFTAWETGGKQYNPGDEFTVGADTVFTAVWKSSSEVVSLTWNKNGAVSPDDSTVFPNQTAPGDFLFMAYAVTKDSGDDKVWILESVTAKTVSGNPVPTRKEIEMMDEIWYISVPAEATVITLNWKEKTDVTVTSLLVRENNEYTEGDPAIDILFHYIADFNPAKGNLKITKDGQEVEILSYYYHSRTAEEKIGECELSPEQGAGQYLLQIIVNGKVLEEASFNVTLTDSGDPTTPQTHTVTFNAGGGTGTVDPMTVEAGTVITLPSADGLSRQYYTFTAWETGENQYNQGDEFTVNADTVFTAVWTRNTIKVTYEANHESVTSSPHTETVNAGENFPLPENPFSNSPAGQIFYGWALTQTPQESDILEPNTEYTAGEADIIFYAVWVTFTEGDDPTTPQTHTVTFNAGGGTGTVDPMTAETGSAITLPSADGLSRQYYTFTAWKTGGKQYNPGDEFTVSAETVFTAVWTRNTITVTYEANNTSVMPATHKETVDAGGMFYLSGNPFVNSPAGQIFYGWALTQTPQDFDILKPNAYSFAKEDDITFYAVWKSSSEVVSLTWNKNGGETYSIYQEDAFPVAVNQGATVMLEEMYYFKNDGDAPYILTGIKVTETANGTPVNVTKSDGDYSPCWSFQAGTEALTVELLWEEQSIEGYTFDVAYALYEENYIDMPVYTDIALSPGMITVTDETGKQVIPSQKTAACAQIQNGMRTHSCFIEFDPNIPAGVYNVIVTVSGQTIHTETVTVSEPQP